MLQSPLSGCLLLSSWFVAGAHALATPSSFRAPRTEVSRHYSFLGSKRSYSSLFMVLKDSPPPDFTVIEDDDHDGGSENEREGIKTRIIRHPKRDASSDVSDRNFDKNDKRKRSVEKDGWRPPKSPSAARKFSTGDLGGTSWIQKNAAFMNEDFEESDEGSTKRKNQTFRQDFQGTRVFVKGIPPEVSWQDLKDHFAVAGTVVFASVSIDPVTGESKGVGIVQFETNEMAHNAIRTMRSHPLNGSVLYVREDVQEKRGESAQLRNQMPKQVNRNSPPSKWECADDENSSILSAAERDTVVDLISNRDAARRKKLYDESDRIRNDLKIQFGVHLDDRLKQWWVSFDGSHVPNQVKAVKGEGRWGGRQPWRQIPTTPENDACVNPDLVNGLLTQRDIARLEKDFATADALLEEARTSPDGNLYLRIHDESRTWRIWTTEKPPRPDSEDHGSGRKSAAEQCIQLVRERAPHKEEEIRTLLEKFPGREYPILKKLKQSFRDD